ncbi:hypothetical protein HK102_010645 [Quaeritorhiza haematococci]|nr:hypothetical protein HK102_010645 [Quaeritorhiza haematococci]
MSSDITKAYLSQLDAELEHIGAQYKTHREELSKLKDEINLISSPQPLCLRGPLKILEILREEIALCECEVNQRNERLQMPKPPSSLAHLKVRERVARMVENHLQEGQAWITEQTKDVQSQVRIQEKERKVGLDRKTNLEGKVGQAQHNLRDTENRRRLVESRIKAKEMKKKKLEAETQRKLQALGSFLDSLCKEDQEKKPAKRKRSQTDADGDEVTAVSRNEHMEIDEDIPDQHHELLPSPQERRISLRDLVKVTGVR